MITTNRNVLVGGHTTESVKKAIAAEAKKRETSSSRLIHKILIAEMRRRGYEVEDEIR